jgi:cell division protein FtsZ
VLINITAGPDLTLFELDEAANRIRAEVDPDANIMVGSTLDPEMAGMMRVSVVATGIDAVARVEARPVAQPMIEEPAAAQVDPIPAREPEPVIDPQPQQQPEHAASFADAQVVDFERDAGFAPEEVPQPNSMQRTAPYGQPKIEAQGSGFGRRIGEPSPDALRRLQAAVQNVPKAEPMARTAAPREADRQSRLTINSLIHKMTGQSGTARARATDPRIEPQAQPQSDVDFEDTDRERVDIPAFLRRQAN